MPPIDPPKTQHQLSGSETAFFAYQMAYLCFLHACRSFPGGLHCTWPFSFLETAVGLGQKTLQNRKIDLSELQTLPDCPFLTTVASALIMRSFWALDGRKWPRESEMALILVPSMGPVAGWRARGGSRFSGLVLQCGIQSVEGGSGAHFHAAKSGQGLQPPMRMPACTHVHVPFLDQTPQWSVLCTLGPSSGTLHSSILWPLGLLGGGTHGPRQLLPAEISIWLFPFLETALSDQRCWGV